MDRLKIIMLLVFVGFFAYISSGDSEDDILAEKIRLHKFEVYEKAWRKKYNAPESSSVMRCDEATGVLVYISLVVDPSITKTPKQYITPIKDDLGRVTPCPATKSMDMNEIIIIKK